MNPAWRFLSVATFCLGLNALRDTDCADWPDPEGFETAARPRDVRRTVHRGKLGLFQ